MSYIIRRMSLDDVEAVYDIEENSHISPWSKQIIHDCVQVGYGCFVLTKRQKIRGFMIARAITGECHLLNLCIAVPSQGKGFGQALLLYLIDFVKPNCNRILLEVRPSNKAALSLYDKHGFIKCEIKKDYYTDPDGRQEDAIVLELIIN